jgi:hypothetical protein
MELELAKFKTHQIEKSPSLLSMNTMAEAIKVLQTLWLMRGKPTCNCPWN